jgi:diaminohydroxyphosphoribosylaminopyrimidine deaminase / 5-amino-6-(5-phosphoribosylamino)uracil reductase
VTLSLQQMTQGMMAALMAARPWQGATAPNPPVGAAALGRDGKILATAAHQRAGEDHAEAALLKLLQQTRPLQDLHTLCVTLAPCNHHGRTPPCTAAIIAAGIKHVVIGVDDPNPQARGGIEHLRQAGIEVTLGVLAPQCWQLLAPFARTLQLGRPWISLKQALDPQGSMVPPTGQKTFTSAAALQLAHAWRRRADALLTGSGTILADDPAFTVRHLPDHPDKQRVLAILDRRKRVPEAYLEVAQARGFIPVIYADLDTALSDLAQRGVREVLTEAGPSLVATLLQRGIWDAHLLIQAHDDGRSETVAVRTNPSLPEAWGAAHWDWQYWLPVAETAL